MQDRPRNKDAFRLGFGRKGPENARAVERLKAWTRARFRLPDDAAILISQLDCTLPGCPPVHTVVAFWTENDKRHHFKVFKPITEVVEDDLPPSWMKNALLETEVVGCPCC
jgi:hypothetical protein